MQGDDLSDRWEEELVSFRMAIHVRSEKLGIHCVFSRRTNPASIPQRNSPSLEHTHSESIMLHFVKINPVANQGILHHPH